MVERHSCPLTDADIEKVKSNVFKEGVIINMQEDIHSLKNDVKEIKDALLGDDFNPGFKQRIEKVEVDTAQNTNRLSALKNYYVFAVGTLTIISIVVGILYKLGVL